MKTQTARPLVIALPLAAAALLTFASCVSVPYRTSSEYYPAESGYVTYASLPSDYSGEAYYYNNRYYAGGRYEPGTYTYRGRTYTHRYYHNGEYLYGGEYRPSPSRVYTRRTYQRSSPVYRSTVRGLVY